jgi:hypothetical protein
MVSSWVFPLVFTSAGQTGRRSERLNLLKHLQSCQYNQVLPPLIAVTLDQLEVLLKRLTWFPTRGIGQILAPHGDLLDNGILPPSYPESETPRKDSEGLHKDREIAAASRSRLIS